MSNVFESPGSDPVRANAQRDAATSAPATLTIDPELRTLANRWLDEQRRARRWSVALKLLWLLLLFWLLWSAVSQEWGSGVPAGPHTALVDLRGEIADNNLAAAEPINSALRDAFEAAEAKAVVLRINSPGGSPVQSGMIYDEMLRLKAQHRKPLYVVCEEACASGGYYIAAAADAIYVDKASLVGSIGVLLDGFGFEGTLSKLGIERRLLTSGENKGMLDPFSPLDPEHRAYALEQLRQIHAQFIDAVREGRGDRLKETPQTFSGLFWTGEEAVKLGLADQLGNLDQVARDVVKAEHVVDYSPQENVAERLAKRLGAAAGTSLAQALLRTQSLR